MEPFLLAAALLVSYLIGSISFARIVTRLATGGRDVADFEIPVEGSDEHYKVISVGANSVSGELGPKIGMLTAALDMLKVIVVTLAFRLLFPGQPYFLVAAVGGMAGHVWPVYYKFHGGSGWSSAIGGLLVIDWLGALACPLISLVFGMLVVRSIPVAILSWLWWLIPWLWFRTHDPAHVIYAVAINLIFFLAMIPEIKLALKYRKEGRLAEYGRGSMASNPMARGFVKIGKRFGVHIP